MNWISWRTLACHYVEDQQQYYLNRTALDNISVQ